MNRDGKRVVIDWDGLSGGVPAGTRLAFAMTREVLGYVDTCAQRLRRSRAWLLLATIIGEEIDPDSPIYVEANLVERSSTFYGPLTFEYGEDLGLAITSTQDEAALPPEGEVCAVLVEIADEAGN